MAYLQPFLAQGGAKLPGQGGNGIKFRQPLRVEGFKELAGPVFGLPIFLCNAAKLLKIKA